VRLRRGRCSVRAGVGARAAPLEVALKRLFILLVACAHSHAGYGEGLASFYGRDFEGKPTASGEPFHAKAMTAAHRTLPFGTCLRVENTRTGRVVEVRVNDRGPYAQGRIVDLSEGAARALGIADVGVAPVRLSACR
jgi:rare lipoprotein A (peptidoglycan hydrolase)